MEIGVALIRHGLVREENGFFGITDIPLTKKGIKSLKMKRDKYPGAKLVFSSCLIRCMDTALTIYPGIPAIAVENLNAPDYGDFEGRLFDDLKSDERFLQWINSKSLKACPGGEEPLEIIARSCAAFKRACGEAAGKGLEEIAVFTHKFNIQAIMQRYSVPRKYTDWTPAAGGGYLLRYNTLTSNAIVLSDINGQ